MSPRASGLHITSVACKAACDGFGKWLHTVPASVWSLRQSGCLSTLISTIWLSCSVALGPLKSPGWCWKRVRALESLLNYAWAPAHGLPSHQHGLLFLGPPRLPFRNYCFSQFHAHFSIFRNGRDSPPTLSALLVGR